MFLSYLLQNSDDSDKIRYAVSLINLRQTTLNIFQLACIKLNVSRKLSGGAVTYRRYYLSRGTIRPHCVPLHVNG